MRESFEGVTGINYTKYGYFDGMENGRRVVLVVAVGKAKAIMAKALL